MAKLATALELSRLTGCSVYTVANLARRGIIPAAVGKNDAGYELWDSSDRKLTAWIDALQRAGYNRSRR